jgi:hypothetical protein
MSLKVPEVQHSKLNMTQYKVASMTNELVQAVLDVMLFYFYEAEIGLDSWLVGLD